MRTPTPVNQGKSLAAFGVFVIVGRKTVNFQSLVFNFFFKGKRFCWPG
jgi:hypothetical protein